MEKKLLELMKNFELMDLLGFGNLLNVEEKENFEDYVVDIVYSFSKQDRKTRKNFLKIAKQISDVNCGRAKKLVGGVDSNGS